MLGFLATVALGVGEAQALPGAVVVGGAVGVECGEALLAGSTLTSLCRVGECVGEGMGVALMLRVTVPVGWERREALAPPLGEGEGEGVPAPTAMSFPPSTP